MAPAILEVLGGYRRLRDVDPGWWIVVVAIAAAGTLVYVCATAAGFTGRGVVSGGHLAAGRCRVQQGRARRVGGGRRAAGAEARAGRPRPGTGLTAGALLLLAALAGLALPAVLLGKQIPDGLLQAAGIGLSVFIALFAIGALLANDRMLWAVGRTLRAPERRLRGGPP